MNRLSACLLAAATLALPCLPREEHREQESTVHWLDTFMPSWRLADVEVKRYVYFGVGENDYCVLFDAYDHNDDPIEGVLCCGKLDSCSAERL